MYLFINLNLYCFIIAPSAAPVSLSGMNLTSTNLSISWEPPPIDDQNGIILGYNVTYTPDNGVSKDTTTNDTMIVINDLLIYTDYNVSVAAHTSVGTGPFDSIVVRTDSSGIKTKMSIIHQCC